MVLNKKIRNSVPSVEKSALYLSARICNKDELDFMQHKLKKRYDLTQHSSRNVLRQAFEKWSNSSRGALAFKDLSPPDRTAGSVDANLDVLFAKYSHGDKESFDGFGGIVAHSGYPVEGIIHFDGSEFWSIDGRNGLDLRYVALHEIGHALGLRHSSDPKAIMHPYYSDQLKEGFELGEDDILGIRKLYGTS
uniref:Peptidase metallopeptidase domain-containing protein n=1 Tax=Setaria digitata TaxID=48799 RepID=A0A915PZJ8_9BILA